MPSPAAATVLALQGRVVTMDSSSTVIQDGVVYIRDNVIVAVQPSSAAQPAGFDQASLDRLREEVNLLGYVKAGLSGLF